MSHSNLTYSVIPMENISRCAVSWLLYIETDDSIVFYEEVVVWVAYEDYFCGNINNIHYWKNSKILNFQRIFIQSTQLN